MYLLFTWTIITGGGIVPHEGKWNVTSLSLVTLSVKPCATIFANVFSLLWACLASLALPWPKRAI